MCYTPQPIDTRDGEGLVARLFLQVFTFGSELGAEGGSEGNIATTGDIIIC